MGSQHKRTDCQRLADYVEQLAKRVNGLWAFRNALYDRFNNRDKPGFDYGEFTSTGFEEQFKDDTGPKNSPNQVYHYVGAFRAGFSLGAKAGLAVMENHENEYTLSRSFPFFVLKPDTPSHKADKALNGVAVRHGAAFAKGRLTGTQLAAAIRKDVCK